MNIRELIVAELRNLDNNDRTDIEKFAYEISEGDYLKERKIVTEIHKMQKLVGVGIHRNGTPVIEFAAELIKEFGV